MRDLVGHLKRTIFDHLPEAAVAQIVATGAQVFHRAGENIEREPKPQKLYILLEGEASLRGKNGGELGRVVQGRSFEMRALINEKEMWDLTWRAETDVTLLAIPWVGVWSEVKKVPGLPEYLRKITNSVELQKLKRDFKMLGLQSSAVIEIIAAMKKEPFADLLKRGTAETFFVVVFDGSIEIKIDVNNRRKTTAYLHVGDQALIDLSRPGLTVEHSPDARVWNLAAADMRQLKCKMDFTKFLKFYSGKRDFDADVYKAERETLWQRNEDESFKEVSLSRLGQSFAGSAALSPRISRPQERTLSLVERPVYVEDAWVMAHAFVQLAAAHGVKIGIHSARRSFAGREGESPARSFIAVCEALGFDVQVTEPKDLLKVKLPAVTLFHSAPVLIRKAGTELIEFESAKNGEVRVMRLVDFIENVGAEVLTIRKTERTRHAPDRNISFWSYLKVLNNSKLACFSVFLAATLGFVLGLVPPLTIQYIFSAVIDSKSWSTAGILIAAFLGAKILTAIVDWIDSNLSSSMVFRAESQFASVFFRRLARLPSPFFNLFSHGDLANRFEEIKSANASLVSLVVRPLAQICSIISCSFILYLYDQSLFIASLVALPFAFLFVYAFSRGQRVLLSSVEEHNASERSLLIEAFDHSETLKASNAFLSARWKWETNLIGLQRLQMRLQVLNAGLDGLNFLIKEGVKIFVLWIGMKLYFQNQLTAGQVIACFFLVERLVEPLWAIVATLFEFSIVRAHLDRLDPIFTTDKETIPEASSKSSKADEKAAIVFENVGFQYGPHARKVIQDVSLEIRAGEKIAIVGRSGSGKSTLVSMINALKRPSNGRVLLNGYDVASAKLDDLRSRIAYVPQEATLFRGSILDNITMNDPNPSVERAIDAARLAEADRFISRLPKAYLTMIEKGGVGLSEGQSQLIHIARAIYKNPEIYVFDEATCHLDPITEEKLIKKFFEREAGKTIIFVTQHINLLSRMDRVFVIEAGTLVEQGNHSELISNFGPYAGIFSRQMSLN